VQTPTAAPLPQPTQPAFSFMGMVKSVEKLAKSSRSKTVDPLSAAKAKILKAIEVQKGYVALVKDGKPLPKSSSGEKTVSAWFSKQSQGWYASIRYGQASIPIVGDKADMLIGELADVAKFYDAVAVAISKGELDAPIADLQTKKSEKLKGAKKDA
jgi:hypothetical protein